jgi:hypothetical protein
MPYVIKRVSPRGGYVAPEGSDETYTDRRSRARWYYSQEEADNDKCLGSEVVESYWPPKGHSFFVIGD